LVFSEKNNETWEEYVEKSKLETIKYIKSSKVEEMVNKEYKNLIYYNLVYTAKSKFENLRKK